MTPDDFLADVAAVHTGSTTGPFGSGRLIAPGLILTAGHVVDYPERERSMRSGWKVHLLGERKKDGPWGDPHKAELLWRGQGDLDLALLRLTEEQRRPRVQPVFASIKWLELISDVYATGFPKAWATEEKTRHFNVPGVLWEATSGSYSWAAFSQAASPDEAVGWKGTSGAAACRIGPDDKLYLLGAIEEVPANFTHGHLAVAQLSRAFIDPAFCEQIQIALGTPPCVEPLKTWQTSENLGVARLFENQTRKFKEEYLVSETGPVPFGGRDRELDYLNSWLFDPSRSPRMLLTAPAGRGKSALLVQWMKALEDGGVCGSGGWQLAFVPISIRIDTNRPNIFYEALARRLAEIVGKVLSSQTVSSPEGFRWAVPDLLDRIGDRRVLIVIDGVDEALRESFDPAILPKALPPNLRIVLSARWRLGDADSKGWLKRLDWERGVKVESFELDPLEVSGIKDVIVKLGAPAGSVARDPALIERLQYLTGGEPLLVRYYAEDLWELVGRVPRVTRADLDELKPGFGSYFDRWFDWQTKLWQEEDARIDTIEVDKVLSVLAFALGPLESADLLALMKQIHGITGVMAADRLLEPLRRFVFGNGKKGAGYVLSHPKIGDYLQQERFAASAGELRCGFALWGQTHLADVNAGRVAPENASAYALQFLPQHLDEAGASPEIFMMMVEDGWRRAWEQLEGGSRGFASTVQAAWSAQQRNKSDLRLGAQWRCALTLSSIRSLGQNIPEEIALAAVQRGVITHTQAVHFANMKGENGITLLAKLAVAARDNHALSNELAMSTLAVFRTCAFPSHVEFNRGVEALNILFDVDGGLASELRPVVLDEALAAAKAIGDEYGRSRILAALAPHLASKQLDEVLAATMGIGNEYGRSRILAALAPHLASKQLDEALAAASAIDDKDNRSRALAALAPHLAPKQLEEALAAARAISLKAARSRALVALTPHLGPELRPVVLDEALAAAKAIGEEKARSHALTALAPHLAPKQLDEALAAAKAIGYEYFRSKALTTLAPHLTPKQLDEALAAARAIGDENFRSNALAGLVPHLAPEVRPVVLNEALAAAKAIGYEYSRSGALAVLAPHLAPKQLDEALAAARAIDLEAARSSALVALTPHLRPEVRPIVLDEALVATTCIGEEVARSGALAALAPYLAPKQLDEALAAARAIDDKDHRSRALVALAPHLAPKQLDEVLAAAQAIGDEDDRSRALIALAPHFPPELRTVVLDQALVAARAIGGKDDRSSALAALTPHLGPELRPVVLDEALAAATYIGEEVARSSALATLAPHLAPKQLAEALTAATTIREEYFRSSALAALAPHFPPELRTVVLDKALAAATCIGEEVARSTTLAALAPHLTSKQLDEALAAARAIVTEAERSIARAALAPHLAPDQLHEELVVAKADGDEYVLSSALVALAPHLSPKQLGEVLAVAKAIGDDYHRSRALAALAPHFPPELRTVVLDEALVAARAIDGEGGRSRTLTALAPQFPPELRTVVLDEALAATKAIGDEFYRSRALVALAPHLAPKQLDEVLAAVKALGDEGARSRALVALAPHLAPKQLDEALAVAKSMGNKHHCIGVLVALVNYPFALQDDALLALIDAAGNISRPVSLSAARSAVQPTSQFGGQGAIHDLWRAVSDVCHWYP